VFFALGCRIAQSLLQSSAPLFSALPECNHAVFAIIVDVGRVADAYRRPDRGAWRLAARCGPRVDKPVLHSQWVAIALASLVSSCDRCAHVRSQPAQVAGDSELRGEKCSCRREARRAITPESETPASVLCRFQLSEIASGARIRTQLGCHSSRNRSSLALTPAQLASEEERGRNNNGRFFNE
jgi:hypothetical protein